MFAKINSLGLFGLNAFNVDVEIEISRGIPAFDIVGLPDLVVKESRKNKSIYEMLQYRISRG